MEVAVFSFGEASCLKSYRPSHLRRRFSNGPVIVTRFFFHMCVFLRRPESVPFHGRQCTMSSHSSCRTALRERYLTSRPSHTSNDSVAGLALQDEWAAMPQQLIDTLILSMGRRCETCLAVMGDHIPY
ncbi:hypothetical protein TNCV_870121 [Trichonephila clavipes]|nr:hypothetical protein TNCV_870121 [Trichonephila clavipes]